MIKYLSFAGRGMLFVSLSFSVSYASIAESTDVIVVANSAAITGELSRSEIRQVFMGGTLSRKYEPVSLSVGSNVRIKFNTKVIGLTESRIQSYWAQLLFSGRSKPPKEFTEVDEVLEYISTVDNAVGYVPSDTVIPANLVVIYRR
jgi:hypothetical protein